LKQSVLLFAFSGEKKVAIQKGTAAKNSIYGTASADTQYGYGGNDYIEGRGGNDKMYGGDGLDRLFGGNGNDFMYGENGNDSLFGGAGNDTVDAGANNDRVLGGDGNDNIKGGIGNDTLSGGSNDDFLYGGDGNDKLFGDIGSDRLYGGNGNDALEGNDKGPDWVYGEGGNDIIRFTEGDYLDGGIGNDAFNYTAEPGSSTWTNFGNTIIGGAGTDTVTLTNNHASADSYATSQMLGIEFYYASEGLTDASVAADFSGIERIVFAGTQNANYLGGRGPAANMEVVGSKQGDYLLGSAGNDILKGGAGDDHLYGGHGGTNTLTGGSGQDVFGLFNEKDGVTHITDFHKGEDRLFLDANMHKEEINGSTVFTVDHWDTDDGVSKLIVDGVVGIRYGFDYDINDASSKYSGFYYGLQGLMDIA
jgi:Ca2+-binding RTX toxin-like protein